MEKESKLEELLINKSYHELTAEEQLFVQEELGSEAQYTAMRKVSLALITSKVDLSPDPFIVKSLQGHMRERQTATKRSLFTWQMPAYATLVLVISVGMFSWWLGSRQQTPTVKIVELIKHDTVFLTGAADTLFKDRIVYRTVVKREKRKAQIQLATKINEAATPDRGVNMKEKQDLELLLVSGK